MFTRMILLSYIGEVLHCHCDERSAEGPFGSFTSARQIEIYSYSLEVLVKKKLIKSQVQECETCSND